MHALAVPLLLVSAPAGAPGGRECPARARVGSPAGGGRCTGGRRLALLLATLAAARWPRWARGRRDRGTSGRRRERALHLRRDRAVPAPRSRGHRRSLHRRPDARLVAHRYGGLARGRAARRRAPRPSRAPWPSWVARPPSFAPKARAVGATRRAGSCSRLSRAPSCRSRCDQRRLRATLMRRHRRAMELHRRDRGDGCLLVPSQRAGARRRCGVRPSSVPWWGWLGGLCGATYVTSVFLLIPHIGSRHGRPDGRRPTARLVLVVRHGWLACPGAPSRRPAWPASPSCSAASRSSRSADRRRGYIRSNEAPLTSITLPLAISAPGEAR